MKRPCLDCGGATSGSRCAPCDATFRTRRDAEQAARRRAAGDRRTQYSAGGYRGRAAAVRASAERCWVCGDGPRPSDPWQADHVIPVADGGAAGPLAAAHRSCNVARANALRAGRPDPAASAVRRRSGDLRDGTTAPSGPGARLVDVLEAPARGGGARPDRGQILPQRPTYVPGLARGGTRTGSGPVSGAGSARAAGGRA